MCKMTNDECPPYAGVGIGKASDEDNYVLAMCSKNVLDSPIKTARRSDGREEVVSLRTNKQTKSTARAQTNEYLIQITQCQQCVTGGTASLAGLDQAKLLVYGHRRK